MRDIKDDVDNIIVSEEEITKKVSELGRILTEDYKDKQLLCIGVLKGALMFIADLVRAIPLPLQVDFMAVSSYGSATRSSGIVRILKDLDEDISGKHILIVEDILDTGLTLNYLIKNLKSRQPASLEICSLLVKKDKQTSGIDPKYVGFTIPDMFVVGYGLDYDENYRNLKFVGELKKEILGS